MVEAGRTNRLPFSGAVHGAESFSNGCPCFNDLYITIGVELSSNRYSFFLFLSLYRRKWPLQQCLSLSPISSEMSVRSFSLTNIYSVSDDVITRVMYR